MPMLSHIIQSYDTAFTKKETGDYSAITTWGVFYPDEVTPNIILLDLVKDRFEFPELKKIAIDQYKYWEPESVIVKGVGLTVDTRITSDWYPRYQLYT